MIRKKTSSYNTFCPHCSCFRDGSMEFTTSSGRKQYYSFLCELCLLPSDGFIVKKELKKLLTLLRKKGILVETLSGVGDKEMYRFVTEEIFRQEIQNIRMPNWTIHMLYEEFHPSDEFDIKNQCGTALAFLFDKSFITADFVFMDEMKSHLGLGMDKEELIEKIDTFKLGYNQIQFIGAQFKSVDLDPDNGTAHISVVADFRTQTQKGRRFKNETAEVDFKLVKDPNTQFWMIEQMTYDALQ